MNEYWTKQKQIEINKKAVKVGGKYELQIQQLCNLIKTAWFLLHTLILQSICFLQVKLIYAWVKKQKVMDDQLNKFIKIVALKSFETSFSLSFLIKRVLSLTIKFY